VTGQLRPEEMIKSMFGPMLEDLGVDVNPPESGARQEGGPERG
jgi:hypothetical protein